MPSQRLILLLLAGLLTLTSGCSSRKPVRVLVTLDGKPVEGATVVLISDQPGVSVNGFTAADGIATLDSSNKAGVQPGTFKVLVTKTKPVSSASMDPTSPDAMKAMMKAGKSPAKSELPELYGDPGKTPLTLKVPSDSDPGKIELKSKL